MNREIIEKLNDHKYVIKTKLSKFQEKGWNFLQVFPLEININ